MTLIIAGCLFVVLGVLQIGLGADMLRRERNTWKHAAAEWKDVNAKNERNVAEWQEVAGRFEKTTKAALAEAHAANATTERCLTERGR